MHSLRLLLLATACLLPAVSAAQWQWLDKDGRKVFSDRPPPGDIPQNKILRQPASVKIEATAPTDGPTAASNAPAPQAAASAPKLTGKDKELEDKKKQAEAAEAEKKKAADVKLAQDKADNCKRTKESKAMLDSGQRISRMNDKGERVVMEDKEREAESRRLALIIGRDC